MRKPRSQVLADLARDAVRHTGLTERTFADAVVEAYHARVARCDRTITFHLAATADQVEEAERANAQILKRFATGEVRFPVDVVDAWIDALPQPWRQQALVDAAERHGLLAAPKPAVDGNGQVQQVASVLRESADVVDALADVLADGVIDADDRPRAKHALSQITELQAALVPIQRQLVAILDDPKPTRLRSAS